MASRQPNLPRELRLTFVALGATFIVSSLLGIAYIEWIAVRIREHEWIAAACGASLALVVLVLVYGGVVYQGTRIGFLLRLRKGHAAPDSNGLFMRADTPVVLALVPSYKEDPRLVRQTLMSIALQDYPRRRVTLLIDDPPRPSTRADAEILATMRDLPRQLQVIFDSEHLRYQAELCNFRERQVARESSLEDECERLHGLYSEAAGWFERQAQQVEGGDHTDRLYRDLTLLTPARRLRSAAASARQGDLDVCSLEIHYRRLAGLFDVEFASFERKVFLNLSHEPNKAMNLNSYLCLVGGRFKAVPTSKGLLCEPAGCDEPGWDVADADYILTLDADSLLANDYLARLVAQMEMPENSDVAIIQTPYSAIPGSTQSVERISGASTDIQYLIHQGFTYFNATFWVGANALLRKRALDEIAGPEEERGFQVMRYIHDRTVIEDTETTIDMVSGGWRLLNYPLRLSFSATPADFGALLIQRRRWANGGLIIMPKLLRYLGSRPPSPGAVAEAGLRVHYLGSIAAVNFGLLFILTIPFSETMWSWLMPLSAAPYFSLYARDLRHLGYRFSDLFRVYALNLLLLPVNLGGVLKSLQQAVTKKKIPFGRTPKVEGRTQIPAGYVAAEYVLLASWLLGGVMSLLQGNYILGGFALMNGIMLGYALAVFVGFRAALQDLVAPFPRMRRLRAESANPT